MSTRHSPSTLRSTATIFSISRRTRCGWIADSPSCSAIVDARAQRSRTNRTCNSTFALRAAALRGVPKRKILEAARRGVAFGVVVRFQLFDGREQGIHRHTEVGTREGLTRGPRWGVRFARDRDSRVGAGEDVGDHCCKQDPFQFTWHSRNPNRILHIAASSQRAPTDRGGRSRRPSVSGSSRRPPVSRSSRRPMTAADRSILRSRVVPPASATKQRRTPLSRNIPLSILDPPRISRDNAFEFDLKSTQVRVRPRIDAGRDAMKDVVRTRKATARRNLTVLGIAILTLWFGGHASAEAAQTPRNRNRYRHARRRPAAGSDPRIGERSGFDPVSIFAPTTGWR